MAETRGMPPAELAPLDESSWVRAVYLCALSRSKRGTRTKHTSLEEVIATRVRMLIRQVAHRRVARALGDGALVRPETCELCGLGPRPGAPSPTGRPTWMLIHAHHPDYAQPLSVVWLCTLCHRREHARIWRAAKEAA